MALTEAQLIAMYPETQYLLDLREAGWSFQPHTIDGETAIVGFRSWPTHTDAITVKEYLSRTFAQLGCANRVQAALMAYDAAIALGRDQLGRVPPVKSTTKDQWRR